MKVDVPSGDTCADGTHIVRQTPVGFLLLLISNAVLMSESFLLSHLCFNIPLSFCCGENLELKLIIIILLVNRETSYTFIYLPFCISVLPRRFNKDSTGTM